MTHTPKNGAASSNTPDGTWDRPDMFYEGSPNGTIVVVNVVFGSSTRELMTVVSPSMLDSPDLPYELFNEAQEIWLLDHEI